MGETIKLTAADGHELDAYRADPAGAPKGGIVVIREIFGVNVHVRDVCDRLADQGYTALAPALFDRIRPGIELGYTEDDLGEGFGYMQEVGNDTPMADIQAAGIKPIVSANQPSSIVFRNVAHDKVMDFVSRYEFHPDSIVLNIVLSVVVSRFMAREKTPENANFIWQTQHLFEKSGFWH